MALPKKKMALAGCGTIVLILICSLLWLNHLLFDRTPGQYFDSNGVKIYYTTEGNEKGDPVILIHGLAAQADINWRRPGVVGMLDPDFRVITFDLRGHGLSDHPHDAAQYGLETVEDITRLMDHLKIHKAHLAGYSLGGFLALKFAALHPERCLSLEICASGWKDPASLEPLRNPYKDDPDARLPDDPKKHQKLMRNAEKLTLSMRLDKNEDSDRDFRISRIEEETGSTVWLPSLVSPLLENPINPKIPVNVLRSTPSTRSDRVLEAGILPSFDPVQSIRNYFGDKVVDREAMHALRESVGVFAITADQVKAIPVPTLCLMGTRDGLKPYALDLKQAMPQCELVLIDGSNHITTVINGDFQEHLHKFLLDHRTAK